MQHYGIPTFYLDFTTDAAVAGFFAADTKSPPPAGTLSCIYCLNTDDLERLWKVNRSCYRGEIRIVTLPVDNLWRLQAQKGAFLYATFDWDLFYPMDRILFRYTSYPSLPGPDMIYPTQRSPLETLLDQFFSREREVHTAAAMRQLAERLGPRAEWIDIRPPQYYNPTAIRGGALTPHPSWTRASFGDWHSLPIETYADSAGSPVVISLRGGRAAPAVRSTIEEMMNSDPTCRTRSIQLRLEDISTHATEDIRKLESLLIRVWDGMRPLPFEDSDILKALENTAALLEAGYHKSSCDRDRVANAHFGPAIELEFGATDDSSSRAHASTSDLSSAVRDDIARILTDEYLAKAGDISWLLPTIFSPQCLFDFQRFTVVFAHQVIPTQALRYDHVLYSPARLKTFGIY